ncbi:MAG: thiolase domain-containing protein, partial [Desulfobacterales bacterium]|nr:thiolase domain-containing protein [Desulfobacterales bacterium]
MKDVLNSEMMAYPVNRLDISPTSDGASAIILASENVARRVTEKPVWIDGIGYCLDTAYWCNRDLYY